MNGETLSIINLPFLLVGSLLLLASLTYLLRVWGRVVGLAAALFTASWAAWLWQMDLSQPLRELPLTDRMLDLTAPLARGGFILQLQAETAPVLVASLWLASVAFLLAARSEQGRSFVALGLVLLAGYLALFMVTSAPVAPPLLAPLFLLGLTILSIPILQAGRTVHLGGLIRLLLPALLAFPLMLLATWYIDMIPLNPQDTGAAQSAAQLLAVGLLLLMAPVPLHGAAPVASEHAPPVATAFTTLLYQLAVLHILFRTITLFPLVTEQAPLGVWLNWAGIATAVWGGFAAAGATQSGRLWGYAALHDWGLVLMVLAVPGVRSLPLAIFLFSLRAISMMTAAAGLSVMDQHAGGLNLRRLQGAGSRLPWNCAAFLLGGLGLVGFPLSAGFTGHWAALQIVAETDWRQSAVVLLASGAAIFGFIRLARTLYGPLENRALLRERPLSAALALVTLIIAVGLAVAPQLLDGPISRALLAFSG